MTSQQTVKQEWFPEFWKTCIVYWESKIPQETAVVWGNRRMNIPLRKYPSFFHWQNWCLTPHKIELTVKSLSICPLKNLGSHQSRKMFLNENFNMKIKVTLSPHTDLEQQPKVFHCFHSYGIKKKNSIWTFVAVLHTEGITLS